MDHRVIFTSFTTAAGQLSDPRFRSVLLKGLALTFGLLISAYLVLFWGVQWMLPDQITLPCIGEITFLDDLLSWGSVILLFFLSPLLMVPVASAFTGLFLDDVADAVEAEHYPSFPPARRVGIWEGLRESLRFLGVLVAANLAALLVYIILAPLAPLIFYGLNGFLLGREYYRMIAVRRLGREGATAAFRHNLPTIWIAGALMAFPLTIPLVNLLVPVVAAATFTHIYHHLERG